MAGQRLLYGRIAVLPCKNKEGFPYVGKPPPISSSSTVLTPCIARRAVTPAMATAAKASPILSLWTWFIADQSR